MSKAENQDTGLSAANDFASRADDNTIDDIETFTNGLNIFLDLADHPDEDIRYAAYGRQAIY